MSEPSKHRVIAGVASALLVTLSLACATVHLDYFIDVNLPLRVFTTEGLPLDDVSVSFSDGLAEKALATTGADGRAVLRHAFVWGHKKGSPPTPPRFTLKLARAECATVVLEHTLRPPPPEELRIEMSCPKPTPR